MKSAAECGLVACPACGTITRANLQAHAVPPRCQLCFARLHSRKPMSLQRSWAWLIAGIIAYIPANLYPIMFTTVFGDSQPNTIIGGIIVLLELESYPVALVVFLASVVVPVLKFVAVAYLLISIQKKFAHSRYERTRLFRLTEFIGRWSMIDVFVVAILAALVQIRSVAQIEPGLGAMAFGAAVIFTMLSALALDPRLIWD
jgi:paraquat-inducible protein A